MSKPPNVVVEPIGDLDFTMQMVLGKLDLPRKVEHIVIKPNLCEYRRPETGAVSDPKMLASLLGALRKSYPKSIISIIENDATSVNADLIFKYLKLNELKENYSAEIVNIAHHKWLKKQIDGYIMKTIEVPAILENCDLLITHPKLKTHSMTKITCGLKNMFGCYHLKRKVQLHRYLDEAIVDINLALKPQVSIVDANICMEGLEGPCFGIPRRIGMVIGGRDTVAVDAFCAKLIGFRPWFVGHIRKSSQKKLGQLRYELSDGSHVANRDLYHFDFDRKLYYLLKLSRRLVGGLA